MIEMPHTQNNNLPLTRTLNNHKPFLRELRTHYNIMASHRRVVSDSGSVRLQEDERDMVGEPAEGNGQLVPDDTEEIVRDTTRIGIPETPIDARATDVLTTATNIQSGNLFGPKVARALSANQVCDKMGELSDSESKYAMATNWFTVKLEEAEEDSRQLVQVWEHLQRIPDFKTLRKKDRELWTSVQGIKKRHFDTERRKGGNWAIIRQQVGDEAVTLLT